MTISEIDAHLQKIWKEYDLEPEIKERGFAFAEPKRAELRPTAELLYSILDGMI